MNEYDQEFDPPAPIISIKVANPNSRNFELLRAQIDTGADISAIPGKLIGALELAPVRYISSSDYKGRESQELTYFVNISFQQHDFSYIEVISGEEENALLGRDVLNKLRLVLDGKALHFEITDP